MQHARPSGVLVRTAWAYLGAYLAWVGAMLAGFVPRGIANDLLFLPLYFGAGVAGLRAAQAHAASPRSVWGWRLVGAAWLSSGLAATLLAGTRVWPSVGLHTVATVIYQAYFLFMLLGLWQLTEFPSRALSRTRLAVEGLIVVVVTCILAWYWVFRFDEAAQRLGPFLKLMLVLFPGELVVALGAVAIVHRPAQVGASRTLSILSVGVLAGVVADLVYEYHRLIGRAWSGPMGDAVLGFAAVLVITAGLSTTAGRDVTRRPVVSIGLALAPYLPVGVVGALTLAQWLMPDPEGSALVGLVLGGAILMGLLIVRLVVAQRELAEESRARAEQDARFRSLVQHSVDAILVVDHGGRIQYASPAFGAMIGRPGEDLAGDQLGGLITVDQPGGLETWLAQPGPRTIARWKAGDHGEIEALATDHSGDSAVRGIVINARDVTERSRLEARLQQAQKMEAIGQLTGGFAHDFNNILTVILCNADLMAAELPAGAAMQEDLAELVDAARRGARMIARLLQFSRHGMLAMKPVRLGTVVTDLGTVLRRLLPETVELVATDLTDTSDTVLADAGSVEQMLINLCTNARDAMPQGGRLRIECAPAWLDAGYQVTHPWVVPGAYLCVAVTDSGIGMGPETIRKIFEPFFTTKPVGQGTGLGLAMVYGLMKQHNGMVNVSSEPGEGTTVKLYFPVAREAHTRAPLHISDPCQLPTGTETILLAEDDPGIRRATRRALESQGYSVLVAEDGQEALELYRASKDKIRLVVSDLVMPRLGGRQLAEALWQEGARVKVLFMSGYSPEDPYHEAAFPPGSAFLQKPWVLTDLFTKVRELLGPPGETGGDSA